MNHRKMLKLTGAVGAALIAQALVMSPAFGATYNLRAAETTIYMPDPADTSGTPITMWGFADVDGDNIVKVPGPRLVVPAGEGLTINLINDLSEPVSIIIPGQPLPLAQGATEPQVTRNLDGRIRSFVHETPASGGQASYTWSSIKPGTYLYQSGSHPAVQVQMGLYGAVTKNEVDAPATIYGRTYDNEVLIIYSEIDPVLHATYGTASYSSTIDYHPKYFLVNGVASDPTGPIATVDAGSTTLVRLLNAGLKDHAPEILGSHLDIIAEDGNPYTFPKERCSALLAAGKALDALLSPSEAGNYPLFDRRFYRTNDPTVQGTLHAYITVQDTP